MEIKGEFKRCLLPDDIEVKLKDVTDIKSKHYPEYNTKR